MKKIQLSPNFYLHEFTRSQAAARHGIEIKVPEDSEVFTNLKHLTNTGLQPARDALGPVFISSGYRPELLNKAIGGSSTSAHVHGLAGDISVVDYSPLEVAEWYAASDVEFDQVIHEFGQWVHVGMAERGAEPRRELLTAVRKGGRTYYVHGIHSIEEALEMVG